MPKILCIASLAISALVFLLFTLNLIMGIPFGTAVGLIGNLGMMFGSAIIAAFSVLTFPECR